MNKPSAPARKTTCQLPDPRTELRVSTSVADTARHCLLRSWPAERQTRRREPLFRTGSAPGVHVISMDEELPMASGIQKAPTFAPKGLKNRPAAAGSHPDPQGAESVPNRTFTGISAPRCSRGPSVGRWHGAAQLAAMGTEPDVDPSRRDVCQGRVQETGVGNPDPRRTTLDAKAPGRTLPSGIPASVPCRHPPDPRPLEMFTVSRVRLMGLCPAPPLREFDASGAQLATEHPAQFRVSFDPVDATDQGPPMESRPLERIGRIRSEEVGSASSRPADRCSASSPRGGLGGPGDGP